MGRLTIEQILAAPIAEREVQIPEWGGTVLLRALTARQRQELVTQATSGDTVDGEFLGLLILQASLVDPVLTLDQTRTLSDRSATAMDRLALVLADLAGLGEDRRREMRAQFLPGDGGAGVCDPGRGEPGVSASSST